MKRYILFVLFCFCAALPVSAQQTVGEVLQLIEANNRELQAGRQQAEAQKLEAGLENNLPDPSVSYVHQYGNRGELGQQGELVASQSFDFPSLYVQRGRLTKITGVYLDRQQAELRQRILLEAKLICLDLVFLNQQQQLLDMRRQNAEQLAALYAVRLQNGDANVLELNKIELELLNAKNEARMNASARNTKLQELAALNGGEPVAFTDTTYAPVVLPATMAAFKAEALAMNPQLLALEGEQQVARQQITVNKNRGLPALEVGYRLNTAVGGERFNGFLVGMSIPLFANRNYIRQAKAQQLYTELQMQQAVTQAEQELMQLYAQAQALKISIDEYRAVLENQQHLTLLNKAIQAGQISMIAYFVDVSTLYDSLQNYSQLQNEYQKILAELYKYRL